MNSNWFKAWLGELPLSKRGQQDILARARRVEKAMGDLDEAYEHDKCAGIIAQLTYTAEKFRYGMAPAHPIAIHGNAYTGTLCLKRAIEVFVQFKNATSTNRP